METPRSSPAPFPWNEAMAFGFGVLWRSSAEFWAMTPRELASASRAVFGAAREPVARSSLEALMRAFPDDRSDR